MSKLLKSAFPVEKITVEVENRLVHESMFYLKIANYGITWLEGVVVLEPEVCRDEEGEKG